MDKTLIDDSGDTHKALKTFKPLFGEFNIAKDLRHKNIVKYKYFVRREGEAKVEETKQGTGIDEGK